MVEHIFVYTKKILTLHFKWVRRMGYKLDLNKAIKFVEEHVSGNQGIRGEFLFHIF